MSASLKVFRLIAFAEGLSYVVLLLGAMPLKYIYHKPEAVEIVGAIHGGLFVAYVLAIAWAGWQHKWSLLRMIEAFVASLIPLGTFALEYKYHAEFTGKSPPAGK